MKPTNLSLPVRSRSLANIFSVSLDRKSLFGSDSLTSLIFGKCGEGNSPLDEHGRPLVSPLITSVENIVGVHVNNKPFGENTSSIQLRFDRIPCILALLNYALYVCTYIYICHVFCMPFILVYTIIYSILCSDKKMYRVSIIIASDKINRCLHDCVVISTFYNCF